MRIFCFIAFYLGCAFYGANSVSAQIPIISIHSNEEIIDEPKVPATFTYTGVDGEVISSNIGIEIRGGFSQDLPKKTYDIEFWDDPTGNETLDVQFGELREDDDWILDAMYNEPLRLNSFITHKIWLDMNELYYADQEEDAKSGADVMYAEVYLNNEYQGIYLLSEQVDRNQLKLKRNVGTEMRGELYKAIDSDDATNFNNPDVAPNNNFKLWSGYEFKYPSDFREWSNVENLVDFVANSSDESFKENVGDRFDIPNLMDYFILLNVARILDNRGKNIYLCRYDANEPYFLTPWDLDGSWGLLWNGSNDTKTEGALSNNLFDRLIETNAENFRQRISDRWNQLRTSILNDDVLEDRIHTVHQFLVSNNVYDKEESAWDYTYSSSDLDYMMGWIDDRMDFLDHYFNIITNIEENLFETLNLFPNPAGEYISISGIAKMPTSIAVYNLFGEQILQFNHMQTNKIQIQGLRPGAYLLSVEGTMKLFYKI